MSTLKAIRNAFSAEHGIRRLASTALFKLRRESYVRRESRGNGGSGRFAHVTYYWAGNAGDTVLSKCVRAAFESFFRVGGWNLVAVNNPVTERTVDDLNRCAMTVIGGGGLFLPDTNANSVSGWQWAIREEDLERLRPPLCVFSVGYNYFPGQKPDALFTRSLDLLVRKSFFMGLRNRGSVLAVQELLPPEERQKIVFQPCTTTLIRKLFGDALPPKRKTGNIAVNMAFDRESLRFGAAKERILSQVAKAVKAIGDKGYRIFYVCHCAEDDRFLPWLREAGVSYTLVDLSKQYPDRVLAFYNDMDLVLGMRGHAQMIPFGLGCNVISLGTHDKLKWFLEDIRAEDWYIDLTANPETLAETITAKFEEIHESGWDRTRQRLRDAQEELWQITCRNMHTISSCQPGIPTAAIPGNPAGNSSPFPSKSGTDKMAPMGASLGPGQGKSKADLLKNVKIPAAKPLVRQARKAFKTLLAKGRAVARKAGQKVERKKEYYAIKRKRWKTVDLSVADWALKNSRLGEWLRCDIAVRYLAIEEYYGLNNFGFALYSKMQDTRMEEGFSAQAVPRFKELIASYERNGYDRKSGILLDRDLNLIDGSHRIALALYHGLPTITAFVVSTRHPVEYSVDWFISHGFTTEEVDKIVGKSKELRDKILRPFSCVVWSPAVPFADGIAKDLALYGTVVSVRRKVCGADEYRNVVRAVYAIDDIEKWKIGKKLEHMEGRPPGFVAMDVVFQDPDFRLKASTGLPLSRRGERAKKAIRAKYKSLVPDYFFDIVLHIGDNIYQSDYMRAVLSPSIGFSPLLDVLEQYSYALAKTDVPYMPASFPDAIPIGKDVDVFCREADLPELSDKLAAALAKQTDFGIVRKKTAHGMQVRVECGKATLFIVDLIARVPELADDFVEEAIAAKVAKNRYWVLSDGHEFVYRLCAYEKARKPYHRDWLVQHAANVDAALIHRHVADDTLRRLQAADEPLATLLSHGKD